MTFIPDKLLISKRIYPKDEQQYYREMDLKDQYKRWSDRANKRIPEIAIRIFNLRGKNYNGHGFHYGMERRLGKILFELNNYDDCPLLEKDFYINKLILKVVLNGLFKEVVKAEKSLR